MIWGIISNKGVGKLIRITNSMNSKQYCDVLDEGLVSTINQYSLDLSSTIFMQDNASCHTSKETKNYLRVNNINVFDWPACSPDLNPIENVWGYLEKKLRKRSTTFNPPDHMWEIIQEEWYKIPQAYINKLYWSMCSRINEVIIQKGNITKY